MKNTFQSLKNTSIAKVQGTHKMITRYVLSLLVALVSFSAYSDVVVVASADSKASKQKVDKSTVARIFLGKLTTLPNGKKVKALNLEQGSKVRNEFNESVLDLTESQLGSYWSRSRFSGKTKPPKEVKNSKEVISFIQNNPEYIGYIDSKYLTKSVKVIFKP